MSERHFAPYTLDQLTMFLAVVDEGSFAAAGRRLGRVQSAVSYGVAQLEDALESALFDRSRRTAVLTDAGRMLAAEARLVLAQARELTEHAARLQAGTEPALRVVVDAVYPTAHLADVCAAFAEAFPATALRVEVGLLGDAVARVARGEADLGAVNLAGGDESDLVTKTHLGAVMLVPVCAAHHPLAALPGPQRGPVLERVLQVVLSERALDLTADQGVLGSRTLRVTDLRHKAALIARGVGWGSLPAPLAAEGLASGALVRLHPAPWPPDGHRVELCAIARAQHPLGRAGQWFREHLALPQADGAGA